MSKHRDAYQSVTDQILAALEAGTVPWRHPLLGGGGVGEAAMPRNLASGLGYRGVNIFTLGLTAWAKGYLSPWWLTYRQATARGGHVRRGEKCSLVVFWKILEKTDPETGKKVERPVLRCYSVFNAEQCSDVAAPAIETPERNFTPIADAERVIAEFVEGPRLEYGGHEASYRPKDDTVRLPMPDRFVSNEEFYGTAFHELVHATGHRSRLDRGLDQKLRPFGSADYSKEELVAEMGAACLCAVTGIAPATVDNQAAYIAGWMKKLRQDKRCVVTAAGAAQKAADWVRNIRPAGRQR